MAPKSVLITGCSAGGIGHALALTFQRKGCMVFATARNISKMGDLKSLPNMHLISLDVTSRESIRDAVAEVAAKTDGRGLDILFNNAGQQYLRPMLDMAEEEARKLFDVNFWGVFAMIQAFMDLLITAKGVVVNTSSISGYWHTPYMSVYNASKAALNLFGETLRLELEPLGVRVVTVITGVVDTNIMENSPVTELPESSRYLPAQKQITNMVTNEEGLKPMGAEEFAELVVSDVLRGGANGKIWRGNYSSTARLTNVLMPTGILDRILASNRGLDAP